MIFFVECKPDYTLVRKLTSFSKKNIIHSGNSSGVIKNLAKKYENCAGLIDEDPLSPKPRLYNRFIEINSNRNYNVKVLSYKKKNNYLFLLCPRLEEWILEASKDANVDVRKYGLENDAERLHGEINVRLDRFENLLSDLIKISEKVNFLRTMLIFT